MRTKSMRVVVASLLWLGLGGPATSELILSDQESEVYYRLAIAAGADVRVDKNSVVTGSLHSNQKVDLKKDTLVDGDVSAVDEVKDNGTVTGTASRWTIRR